MSAMISGLFHRLKSYSNLILNYRAVRNLVTPFSPHLICNFHLSNEIYDKRVRWFNTKSRNLEIHADKVRSGDWLFCDIDRIPDFVENILPNIPCPFVLVSGNWHLPHAIDDACAKKLLESNKVSLWFSHNMCIDHPKCHLFPYGVSHINARRIWKEMRRSKIPRKAGIYFSPFKIHSHYSDEVKASRAVLLARTEGSLPMPEYLRRLREYTFVTSPRGDRPDTYRHWEAIALGCIPISDLPPAYFQLFGNSMIYMKEMKDVLSLDAKDIVATEPEVRLVLVSHWIERIVKIQSTQFADNK